MDMEFEQIGRIAQPGDNVAIAICQIDAGTRIHHEGSFYRLSHTVLEGHRFAIHAIPEGDHLLSWGLPFGTAVCNLEAGHYICNAKILEALAIRHLDIDLPEKENFLDRDLSFELDGFLAQTVDQIDRQPVPCFFDGYDRGRRRGVGTRNYIVVLGTSSLTGSFVRAVADRFKDLPDRQTSLDGVVPVAHTEGGEGRPNNLDMTLRALSGFMVHGNVGAVLAVDDGDEAVNNQMLRAFMAEHGYPLETADGPRHEFLSLKTAGAMHEALDAASSKIRSWIDPVSVAQRTSWSVEHLKVALQCGGSDAFSGVCANPLVGLVAKETIRCGGSANLAETDELIGAESYVLARVRDQSTARSFLGTIDRFKRRAAIHGHNAEGNPSGGNQFRGLYNITIKSIGAARKKDPDVRLDHVIEYAEPMRENGFHFMDSPGNDLESVAGQVAAGSNLILFTTGNGSITNFPFVPTIKIVSTTNRFNLVAGDMDVNAGRYQDGESMEELGRETFQLALEIASGAQSVGERAGHSQVQLWRDWHQNETAGCPTSRSPGDPDGTPLTVKAMNVGDRTFSAVRTGRGFAADQVGAVIPTSLCSGQIARMIVEQLNGQGRPASTVNRFVTFPHTEGCGVSSGENEDVYIRTLVGHMVHPLVRCGVFLEHGCEKTHNAVMRRYLKNVSGDHGRFGWASVQLDGGIEAVTRKVIAWFDDVLADGGNLTGKECGLDHLRLGLTSTVSIDDPVAVGLARLAGEIVISGGTVILPQNASLLSSDVFRDSLIDQASIEATLGYGQRAEGTGLHVMDCPTLHAAETLTGLGATGVDVMLAIVGRRPAQAHPMIPLIQVTATPDMPDADCILDGSTSDSTFANLLNLVIEVASRRYVPKLFGQGYTDFQMTRGRSGISL